VTALTTALLLVLLPLVALAAHDAVPLPRGWIGTTSDWVRGFGIGLTILNLVMLACAWRSLRRSGLTATARGWLLVAVGLVPLMVAFLSFAHGKTHSARPTSTGSATYGRPDSSVKSG
jgi:hypothetical protein